jgi:hypothetical protein
MCCTDNESRSLTSHDENIHSFYNDEHMVVEQSSQINHTSESASGQHMIVG